MKHFRVIATANTMADLPDALRAIGEKRLHGMGISISYADHVDNSSFHTAGSVTDRIADFHSAANDSGIHGIISVYGGYNSNQLLDKLDYPAIVAGGKPVIGYSDFSAILNALAAHGSKQVFHGPSFATFCDPNMFEYACRHFVDTLSGKTVTYGCEGQFASDSWFLKTDYGPREVKNIQEWRVYREGEAIGQIYGGNLETFCRLIGTPYLPSLEGAVLFIEDVSGNNPGAFHRDLTQLRQAGIFDVINGLIIGKFPAGSKLDEFTHLSYILDDVISDKYFPVLCDVFCSHVDPMMTIPLGRAAKFEAHSKRTVTVNFNPE